MVCCCWSSLAFQQRPSYCFVSCCVSLGGINKAGSTKHTASCHDSGCSREAVPSSFNALLEEKPLLRWKAGSFQSWHLSYIEGGNKTQDGVKTTFQLILGSKLIIFNLNIHHYLKFSSELSSHLPLHLLGIQCTFCKAQSLQIFPHFGIVHSFIFLKKKKKRNHKRIKPTVSFLHPLLFASLTCLHKSSWPMWKYIIKWKLY